MSWLLVSQSKFMSFSQFARSTAAAGCALLVHATAHGQINFTPEAGEYLIAGSLAGQQEHADAAISPGGGYLVWQDNITDGDPAGISAVKLDGSLSPTLSTFRVNETAQGAQQSPRVEMLSDGGAVFVWQADSRSVVARFLSAEGTWVTGEIVVSTSDDMHDPEPCVATLADGNVMIAWSHRTLGEGGVKLDDVRGQLFSPAGEKIGATFVVNQSPSSKQLRHSKPSVAALTDGRFVVLWSSYSVAPPPSYLVESYPFGRIFTATGAPSGGEFRINSSENLCNYPAVAPAGDGGFLAVWNENASHPSNKWDVIARPFSASGVAGVERRVNTVTYQNQLDPQVAMLDGDYLVIWQSDGQDGSLWGVFGQFLHGDGSLMGEEFQVNGTAYLSQHQPSLASDGVGRFLTVWSSNSGGSQSLDLKAQRYATVHQPLSPPDAPHVVALSAETLSVTWPALAGFEVAKYELYADGAAEPSYETTDQLWTWEDLLPGSTHTVKMAYVLTDGRRSPLSDEGAGTTYASGTVEGIPLEWKMDHWPYLDLFDMPKAAEDSDGDGASTLDEFLAGTDPNDPTSVLRAKLERTPQGNFLSWETQPGLLYQVQHSSDTSSWSDVGGLRFANGEVDSMYVGNGDKGYYRVLRAR